MLKQLPEDQRRLIEERLSPQGARELEKDIGTEVTTHKRKGSHVERETHPITKYYTRCLREMGSLSKTPSRTRLPNANKAWMEILKARTETGFMFDGEPSFTHPKIAETVMYFGGWNKFIDEFGKPGTKQSTIRNRFVMAYKGLTDA